MERLNYTTFEGGFNQVILEESLVLNLKTTMSFVDFHIDFAINEQYPLYTPPVEIEPPELEADDAEELEAYELLNDALQAENTDELAGESPATQYSYRKGRLFFPNMEEVRWHSRIQPYIDPGSGQVDYGAIDYFYLYDGRYYLAGFWGELEILSAAPLLEIDELKQAYLDSKKPSVHTAAVEERTKTPTDK
jgi:hypothetical protein